MASQVAGDRRHSESRWQDALTPGVSVLEGLEGKGKKPISDGCVISELIMTSRCCWNSVCLRRESVIQGELEGGRLRERYCDLRNSCA